MKPLAIIGSRGHGRCMADIARLSGLTVAGFIDSTRTPGEVASEDGLRVLGGDALLEKAEFLAAHSIGVGIGDPATRRRYGVQLRERGACLPPIVNPSSFISPHARIGAGVLLMGFNAVNHGAVLEDFTALDWHATVGHGARLGEAVFVGPGANIAGDVVCGAETFIGIGARVVEKKKIGSGCVVGAGAVVVKDVGNGLVVVGNPARPIERG